MFIFIYYVYLFMIFAECLRRCVIVYGEIFDLFVSVRNDNYK